MWLLLTGELNFSYLTLPNLNLNSCMWLVVTSRDSTDLNAKAPWSGWDAVSEPNSCVGPHSWCQPTWDGACWGIPEAARNQLRQEALFIP